MLSSKKFLSVAALFLTSIVLSACIPTIGVGDGADEKGEFVEGKIARGFPDNLPLYEDSVTLESYGDGDSFGGSFISQDLTSEVLKFYQQALPALGWETELTSPSATYYIFSIKNQDWRGSVIVNVADDGKKTAVTIAVSKR